MADIKLSNRLSLVVIMITVILGLSLSLFRLWNNFDATVTRIDETVESHLRETQGIAEDAIFKLDEPISQSLVEGSTANPYIIRSELYADDGEKLASSEVPPPDNVWRPLGLPNRIINHPIPINDLGEENTGKHVIVIDYEAGLTEIEFWEQAWLNAFVDFLLIATVSLIIYLISLYYVAEPVSKLASEVDSVAPGENPDKPSLYDRADELGSPAKNTYNYMLQSYEFAQRLREEQNERIELEEKLRHSQKMDAIGQLAGGVAHDFNNIMTVIMGNANLAQTFLNQGHTDRIEKALDAIVQSSERAAKLTNQLLVFSRKDVSEATPILCHELIQNSSKMLERLISEEMHIRYDLQPVYPIIADENQIDLILINLTVNARDAMPDGGDIIISCRNIDCSDESCRKVVNCDDGEFVHLQVTDTGTGIDREIVDRVFDPFFTTKPVGKGTGLGLSTVYGIITKWDGHIAIESEVGIGTTINVYFPVSNVKMEKKSEAEYIPKQDYNFSGRVLICEDDINVRTYLEDLISTTDFEMTSMDNPMKALEAYEENPNFDLLITDIIMPGMNGKELSDALNKIKPVPSIFVSGYSENVFSDKGIITDDITFIQKPFTKEKLFKAIEEKLDNA